MSRSEPRLRTSIVGLLMVALLGVVSVGGWAWLPRVAAARQDAAPSADESPCVPDVDKRSSPARVLLGEAVDVTLTVRAVCPGEAYPLHVVLVLDASAAMAGEPSRLMKEAASELVRGLGLVSRGDTEVGVVDFSTRARTLSPLTDNEARVLGAIDRVGASGSAHIDAGILEGLKALRQGMAPVDGPEVLVLFTAGASVSGCQPVLQAARQVAGQGVLLIAVCAGHDCDEICMRQVASSQRYFFRAEEFDELLDVFASIRDSVRNINIKRLVVKESLAPEAPYVPGSAEPAPSAPISPTLWLQWQDVYVPKEGVTYTYQVRPNVAGYVPLAAESWGELTDNKGRKMQWTMSVPWVTVLDPSALPTPDWTATPTPRATPPPPSTATLTPTSVPSPTDSPAPGPRAAFLPDVRRGGG